MRPLPAKGFSRCRHFFWSLVLRGAKLQAGNGASLATSIAGGMLRDVHPRRTWLVLLKTNDRGLGWRPTSPSCRSAPGREKSRGQFRWDSELRARPAVAVQGRGHIGPTCGQRSEWRPDRRRALMLRRQGIAGDLRARSSLPIAHSFQGLTASPHCGLASRGAHSTAKWTVDTPSSLSRWDLVSRRGTRRRGACG